MKRLMVCLLLLLLLAGCGNREVPDVTQEGNSAQGTGLYAPNSKIEQQTGGAVRAYPLEGDGYTWLTVMGDGLLLGTDDPNMQLTALKEKNCVPGAAASLPAGAEDFRATERGAAYRIGDTIIFLDKTLQERFQIELPADAIGLPVISEESEEIFYCTLGEIRGLDPETGISRLIKQQDCQVQSLEAAYFHGKVLACRITDAEGVEKTLYVDAQSGRTLYTADFLLTMETYKDAYLLTRMDGVVEQRVFGTLEAPQGQLAQGDYIPALALNGVLTYAADEKLHVAFYSLTTGKMTASVDIDGLTKPVAFLADERNNCLWFLSAKNADGCQVLYCWDISKSPAQDETVCTRALVTAQQPDEKALAECQARADKLNNLYGIDIRIWKDAVREPGEYKLTAEHQEAPIHELLDGVEAVASLFPSEFLKKTGNGKLHICLVREIVGQTAVQYWYGGEPYIVFSTGCDVSEEFLDRIGYVIDAYVLGNCVAFDSWNKLNPARFSYDLNYEVSENRPDDQYLEGSKRAFIDKRSMSYPMEDRCRIFAYAMREGCEEYFTSKTMQAKLTLICQGIRQAYGLTKDPREFPWEQYLSEPLAYQK